jgi:hypothetical protein
MRVAQNVLAAFAAVGAVATITLLAAHGPPSGTQSVLNPADLAATWTSPGGGSITFARDHSFVATALRLDKFWNPCAGAGKISVSGTWQFLNSQGGSGPGLTGYPQGSMVDLTFDGAAGNPSIGCTAGFIKLTTWNVGSTPGLCLQFDPDTPCDGYLFSKH